MIKLNMFKMRLEITEYNSMEEAYYEANKYQRITN